ncbi:caspase family protein [Bradyrhizobium sp.]|uniref:caspase family protein n=1 Tax=Bradyrhizobium sp. TaxID=376 RepID=UPI003C37E3CF
MNWPRFQPSFSGFRHLLLALGLLLVCQPAFAEKRVALVIGNSAYQTVAPLPNPGNDAALIAQTLKDAGFDVVDARYNLPAQETRQALREFADQAQDADIAVIYYAGHGIEVDGQNYLVPIDAKLERDTDVYDEGFSLDRVMVAVEPAKQLRLVILDACRDNPFAKVMKRTLATRAVGLGLAKIEPSSPNTLIAYSAKAGSTAQDGAGKNSPFTVALARHLTTPGLDVRKAFGFVRDDVLKITSNRQEPFVYGSLGGDDVALVPAAPRVVTQMQPLPNPQTEARNDYELALQIGNKAAFNAFLAQHPDGFYASLAKLQLDKITAGEAHMTATETARLAEQERARLAAQGAQDDAQAKADADAKAAEAARLAAEKAKQVAQDQAAAAELKRPDKLAELAPAPTSSARSAPDKSVPDKATNVAALTTGPSQADITKSVQVELRRVGCLDAAADGDWDATSKRSLALFNRHAGTKFDVNLPSSDVLDAIRQKQARVCPVVCEHGFRADGEHCARIVCAEGFLLNDDDNECEKPRNKTVKRDDEDRRRHRERTVPADRPAGELSHLDSEIGVAGSRPPRMSRAVSGQIVCDDGGCRPVSRGCHLEFRTTAQGGPREGGGGNVEVCR